MDGESQTNECYCLYNHHNKAGSIVWMRAKYRIISMMGVIECKVECDIACQSCRIMSTRIMPTLKISLLFRIN